MRIRTSRFLRPGQVVVIADYEHPETPMVDFRWDSERGLVAEDAPVPDGRIICCHPDDEQRVRDALALAQEQTG